MNIHDVTNGGIVNYNIIRNPWLFMVFKDSTTRRLSIIEALGKAKQAHLAYSNPMDRVAVFRFLLAAMYWCWKETAVPIQGDRIPKEWVDYLEGKADLFEFLGEGKRFMQRSGLSRLRPASELIHEIPKGNNFWHFYHIRDYTAGICTHCMVSGTLRLPLFFVSGRPNLKSGINGSPPIYAIRWGKNLWDTICLNWQPREDLGEPIWVEPYRYKPEEKVPLLSGMTVPARLLYIDDPILDDRPCCVCGERPGSLHYTCKFEAAGTLENPNWRDPFEIRSAEKTTKASDITGTKKLKYDVKTHRLLPHIMDSMNVKPGDRILLVGFAVDKAKYVDIWERVIRVPKEKIAEDSIELLSNLHKSIKQTASNTYLPNRKARKDRAKKLKESLQNDLLPDAESKVDKLMKEYLAGELTFDAIASVYSKYTRTAARMLVTGISSKQISDRNLIAYSLPKAITENDSGKKQ